MKASKVISLLFSLVQVIFILKLIEYARAAELHTDHNPSPTTLATFQPLTRESKGLEFVAGPRRKKTRTRFPVRASDVLPSTSKPEIQSKQDLLPEEGRNCPGCASGECNTAASVYAIPVLQLKIAFAVIAIWLAIWFKVWKYPLFKPNTPAASGYPAASGGYGYGGYSGGYASSSPAPPVEGGYGGYASGGYNGGDSTDDTGNIFDNVLKAFEKYSQNGQN